MNLFPQAASEAASQVDHFYFFMIAVALFFTIGIYVAVTYFAIRYRRRNREYIPRPIHGSLLLESLWSVIPFIIAMGMFVWATKIYFSVYTPPADATEIFVTGKQWMWKIQHPEGQREINELHIPVGRPIKLTMATEDVIHSFFVPAFRVKHDVVPGHYYNMWFTASKPGKYHLFCAEYCGNLHSGMIGWVYAMTPEDYERWLSGAGATGSMAQIGEQMFQQYGCISCHRTDTAGRCPPLIGVYGSEVLLQNGQRVKADDSYVRESILNPQAKVVAGYQPIMPTFQGQLKEEDILSLIAYIRSLARPQGATGAAAAEPGSPAPTPVPTSAEPPQAVPSGAGGPQRRQPQ